MSTLDTSMLSTSHAGVSPSLGDARVTQWRVIVSEWIKFFSLRSHTIMLLASVIVVVALAALTAGVLSGDIATDAPPGFDGPNFASFLDHITVATTGVSMAILILGTLGVLNISSEYSSGMIRATMAAVPRRLPVLWAKIAVLTATIAVTMTVAMFLAFFSSSAVLGDQAIGLGDPGVVRVLLGNVGYTVGIALIGLALGALLRSTAGGIATLFAAVLIVPELLMVVLPDGIADAIFPYTPPNAAMAFTTLPSSNAFSGMSFGGGGGRDLLSPLNGALVFGAWVLALIFAAAVLLRRRDV